MRLGDRIEVEDVDFVPGKCCASVQGFSLHAGVVADAHDRKRLERLCRTILRGPDARESARVRGVRRRMSSPSPFLHVTLGHGRVDRIAGQSLDRRRALGQDDLLRIDGE
jgi:hypothetical protein